MIIVEIIHPRWRVLLEVSRAMHGSAASVAARLQRAGYIAEQCGEGVRVWPRI